MILKIPEISRARGYRLYDYNGRRIIDMYQNGGHGILGHRVNKLTNIIKNVISRGQIFDLPSVYSRRLKKALALFFPEYDSFRLYSSVELLCRGASGYLGRIVEPVDIYDALSHPRGKDRHQLSYWRPFSGSEPGAGELMVPVLPFSVCGAPRVLCFRESPAKNVLPSSIISPFILAGALRSMYDMKKYKLPAEWELAEGACWLKRGIYLTPLCDERAYEKLFHRFLEEGVLLSPYYPYPSIMPAEVSPGEMQRIRRLFAITPADNKYDL